ncbi:hypothetical protein SSX86_005465 [Deinandra increscens subsp. villosa]|uniref:non-specific serine/threonine protein kinase n=1 Tax=Deinandra increscens subsp. villosa TaxID=3103831 RepID=A0AAP0H8I6_9ASTR
MGGFSFTRVNKDGKKHSKLDRFLVSEDVCDKVSNLEALALGYSNIVTDSWEDRRHLSHANPIRFREKLKCVKLGLKHWNDSRKDVDNCESREIEANIEILDKKAKSGIDVEESIRFRYDLIVKLEKLVSNKEIVEIHFLLCSLDLDACHSVNWAKAIEDHLHKSLKEAKTWHEKHDDSEQHTFTGAAPVLEGDMEPSIQKWKSQRGDNKWAESIFRNLRSCDIKPCDHCSASSGSSVNTSSSGSVIVYPSRDAPCNVSIRREQMQHLKAEGWLSDSIIDFYILKWCDGENIFKKAYIFIPVFQDNHWSLVLICMPHEEDKSEAIMLHLDSLEIHNRSEIFYNILRFCGVHRNVRGTLAPADWDERLWSFGSVCFLSAWGMELSLPMILHWFILGFCNFLIVCGNLEGDALNALKTKLADPSNVMQSWDVSLPNPCTWFHVTCNNENSVTRVDLGSAGLSGQLVPELGQLTNLQYLELYSNNITGNIPDELGNLKSLLSLDLYLNQLHGKIPATLGNLKKLLFLRLNNNSLEGSIPDSLTTISHLKILDLSNNNLTGVVPINGSFSLFTGLSFQNNPNLTFTSPSPQPAAPTLQPPSAGNTATAPIAVGVAAGAALLFAGPLIAIAWWRRRNSQDRFFDVPAEEDPLVHLGQLKRFPLHELQVATDGFSNKNILGRGGFGNVYKGRLADGSMVAVKRLREDRIQGGELQFQTEVEIISMAVHRNLLRLQGFCMTPTERLLVYPYMVNGSVASCLQVRGNAQAVLDWPTRERIALGSAKGLAYLHEHCNPKIIHRDVKAANILLDDEFEAVVGDFGLAKLMDYNDTHVTTAVRGTIGHIAPEYLSTGRPSEKTDVFGYGVMLLELVTGQRAYDLARLEKDDELMLLDWVKGLLADKKLEMLVDTDLEGNYVNGGVEKLIQIALLCTQVTPLDRPRMSEVVKMLEGEGLTNRWEEWKEKGIPRQEFSNNHISYPGFVISNSYEPSNDHLSGPR